MIERIKNNEEKLDQIIIVLKKLNNLLEEFANLDDSIKELNSYYGSSEWFLDKEFVEINKNLKIKAGVLSEDAVWNMYEDIKEIFITVKEIGYSSVKEL